MNTNTEDYIAPFSNELMSDKTLTEIQQLKSSKVYEGYNPNTDSDASELGGDGQQVPLGNAWVPFSFAFVVYMLRSVVKLKMQSKDKMNN